MDAYSGVVFIKSVRVSMFISIHNVLHKVACDIVNYFLEAKTIEKVYAIA